MKIAAVYSLDIICIRAILFKRYLKDKEATIFITSIIEIDYKLIDREQVDTIESETEEERLRRTIPKEYHDLIDTFSKQKSNQLLPYRQCDYKIELEGEPNISFSLLRYYTVEEL